MRLNQVVKKFLPAIIAVLMCMSQMTVAQQKGHKKQTRRAAPAAEEKHGPRKRLERDAAIVQVIKEVSPERIQQNIEKLASFYTRNTLSVNNPDAATSDRGIVAARNWIKSEFERYAAACGGCLEVKTDTFVQPTGADHRPPRYRMSMPSSGAPTRNRRSAFTW